MPRGGARENAGRKAGSATKRTREIADKAAEEGATPLNVMLDNMRFYHERANAALEKLLTGMSPAEVVKDEGQGQIEGDDKPVTIIDAVKLIPGLREKAGNAAKDVAPYMHPRLTPTEDKGRKADDVPLADRLKEYTTRDQIAASGGKVVAIKAGKK